MATPHEPTPSLGGDNSSMSELEEMLSSELRINEGNTPFKKFSDFAEELYASLKDLFVNRRYGRYNSVHVLFLAWQTRHTREIEELAQLDEVFKSKLNFTTERYDITGEEVERSLNLKLEAAVRSHAGVDELFIIYYAGHGHSDMHGNTTTWQPTRDSPTLGDDIQRPLNWSEIEDRLNQSIAKDSNILYIVDSSYKPRKYAPNSRGSKELLATTQCVANYSFTRDLIDELQAHFSRTDSISVSTLHSRMIKRQAERQIPKPYHIPLSVKASSSSIVLASMIKDNPCTPASLRKHSQSFTLCKIQVSVSPGDTGGEPVDWWEEAIDDSQPVKKEGVSAEPIEYVQRLDFDIVDDVHVILVLMPSKVSRKLVKKTKSRAFAELKTVESRAALTSDVIKEALRKAGLPT